MKITALVATSLDGLISHSKNTRLTMSSEEDLLAADYLRSKAGAILVGAATLRKDNSSLLIKNPEFISCRVEMMQPPHPIKVTLTESGSIPPNAKFFEGDCQKIMFVHQDIAAQCKLDFGAVEQLTIISFEQGVNPAAFIIKELEKVGCRYLIIEGGTQLLTLFFEANLVDHLRLSVCPFFIGERNAPRLIGEVGFDVKNLHRFKVLNTQTLGDTIVIDYAIKS